MKTDNVVIGATGDCKGNIETHNADIWGKFDGEIKADPNEVVEYKFLSPQKLDREIKTSSENFTPWMQMEWNTILDSYKSDIENKIALRSGLIRSYIPPKGGNQASMGGHYIEETKTFIIYNDGPYETCKMFAPADVSKDDF